MQTSKHFLPLVVGIAVMGILIIGFLVLCVSNIRREASQDDVLIQESSMVKDGSMDVSNRVMSGEEGTEESASTDEVTAVAPVSNDTSLDAIDQELKATNIADEDFGDL